MIGQVSIAAASATVGTDLFKDQKWNVAGQNRVVQGIAVGGSAAALDTVVELFIGERSLGEFYNTVTGFPTPRDHVIPLGKRYVPAGTKISCIVRDAPATNPINILLM